MNYTIETEVNKIIPVLKSIAFIQVSFTFIGYKVKAKGITIPTSKFPFIVAKSKWKVNKIIINVAKKSQLLASMYNKVLFK